MSERVHTSALTFYDALQNALLSEAIAAQMPAATAVLGHTSEI